MVALCFTEISTPIGEMVAFADGERLYLLAFQSDPSLFIKIRTVESRAKSLAQRASSPIFSTLRNELECYFNGKQESFTLRRGGEATQFQESVWYFLKVIPFGKTSSYSEVARAMHQPSAARAVGSACRDNPLAIIIPCHRVVCADQGHLGSYAGGASLKKWLIEHEKNVCNHKR